MDGFFKEPDEELEQRLHSVSYRPVILNRFLREKKYSRVVETCVEWMHDGPVTPAVRLAYARALYHAGQRDSAEEQFREILETDPENLVALRYLGDIMFVKNDEFAALTCYGKILEIDPFCRALCCEIDGRTEETTRTVSLVRKPEKPVSDPGSSPLRQIHFYTETMGDLYFAQGHNRMALEVFTRLSERDNNPRIKQKRSQVMDKIKDKDR